MIPLEATGDEMNNEDKLPLSIEVRFFLKSLRRICGQDANGKFCAVSELEAIAGLQEGRWTLYTRLGGREIPIVIAADLAGHKFLATRVNGRITDDLLSLPDVAVNDCRAFSEPQKTPAALQDTATPSPPPSRLLT
jgi:hypothetical protein